MKERLNQLSIAEFIELSCGRMEVLLAPGEDVGERQLKERASSLVYEYREIVNPAGARSMLIEKEDEARLSAEILMLRTCESLCKLGGGDMAREVMALHIEGYTNSGEALLKDISGRIREKEFLRKRIEGTKEPVEPPTEKEIRDSFDSEIATVMAYFKMSIDLNVTNAAVYANIVRQAYEDMKRRIKRP